MATDRQIEANRKNSARSTGPQTDEGKARSRLNATIHGLAGESTEVEADRSPEFQARRAKWAAERRPVGEAAQQALDLAVAASLRIDRCGRALDELTAANRTRARLAWDRDRAVEAATVFNRLARDPVLASCQLQASLAGVGLLIQAWLGLTSAMREGGDWSEAQASMALDLLGVAPGLRSGQTAIDDPDGGDAVAFRLDLASGEVAWLESLRDEALAPLDEIERARAMNGELALLSEPAKLVLRYERDAWKRYNQSLQRVKLDEPEPAPSPEPTPHPEPEPEPAPVEPTPAAATATVRRGVEPRAAAHPARFSASIGFDDEPDWLDALDARIGALALARDGFDPRRIEANFAAGRPVAPPPR